MFRRGSRKAEGAEHKKKKKGKFRWGKFFAYAALGVVAVAAGAAVAVGIGLATFAGAAPIGAIAGAATASAIFASGTVLLSKRFGPPTSFREGVKTKAEIQAELDQKERELAERDAHTKALERELEAERQRADAAVQEQGRLTGRLAEEQGRALAAETERDRLQIQVRELQAQLHTAEETITGLRAEVETLGRELAQVRTRAAGLEAERGDLNEQNRTLEARIRGLEENIQEKVRELDLMEASLTEKSQLIHQLEDNLAEMDLANSALEGENVRLKAENAGLEAFAERVRAANEGHDALNAELLAELTRLEGVEAERDHFRGLAVSYSEQLKVLEREHGQLGLELERTKERAEHLEGSLSKEGAKRVALDEKLHLLRERNRALQAEMAEREAVYRENLSEMVGLDGRIKGLEADKRHLVVELSGRDDQIHGYEEQLDTVEEAYRDYEDKLAARSRELAELSERYEQLRDANQGLVEDKGILQAELDEMATLLDEQSGRYRAEVDSYAQKLTTLSELQDHNRELLLTVQKLERTLAAERAQSKQQLHDMYEGYAGNIEQARAKVSEVLQAEARKREGLEDQLRAAKREVEANEKALRTLSRDRSQLEASLNGLRARMAEAGDTERTLRAELGAARSGKENLGRRLQEVDSERVKALSHAQHLRGELEAAHEAALIAAADVAHQREELAILRQSDGAHQELEGQLVGELKRLESAKRKAEAEREEALQLLQAEKESAFAQDPSKPQVRELALADLQQIRQRKQLELFDEPAILFEALQAQGFDVKCKLGNHGGGEFQMGFDCKPSKGYVQLPFAFLPDADHRPIFLEVKPKKGQSMEAFYQDVRQAMKGAFEQISSHHGNQYTTHVFRKSFAKVHGQQERDWIYQKDPSVVYNPAEFDQSVSAGLAERRGAPSRLSTFWSKEFRSLLEEGSGKGVKFASATGRSGLESSYHRGGLSY